MSILSKIFSANKDNNAFLGTKKSSKADANLKDIKIFAGQESYNVAIIDTFNTKDVDINMDGQNDFSHGRIVTEYLTDDIDEYVDLDKFDLNDRKSATYESALDKVIENMQNGKHYDFLNLSNAFLKSYENINEAYKGLNLTPKNISRKSKKLIKELEKKGDSTELSIMEKLAYIQSQGTEVVLSSGNDYKKFNLLSMANGVTTVGPTDDSGEVLTSMSENSLIGPSAQGLYFPSQIYDEQNNPLGYDLDKDGDVDIKTGEYIGEATPFSVMKGTSFSVPTYINNKIKQELGLESAPKTLWQKIFKK